MAAKDRYERNMQSFKARYAAAEREVKDSKTLAVVELNKKRLAYIRDQVEADEDSRASIQMGVLKEKFESATEQLNDAISTLSQKENLLHEVEKLNEQKIKERTERLEYSTQQLAALNDVSNRFTQFFDEDVLLDEAPHLLTHSLDFDRASLLLDKNGELVLRSYCLEKDTPELVENFVKRAGSKDFEYPKPFFESFKTNKTIFIPDLNKDPRANC